MSAPLSEHAFDAAYALRLFIEAVDDDQTLWSYAEAISFGDLSQKISFIGSAACGVITRDPAGVTIEIGSRSGALTSVCLVFRYPDYVQSVLMRFPRSSIPNDGGRRYASEIASTISARLPAVETRVFSNGDVRQLMLIARIPGCEHFDDLAFAIAQHLTNEFSPYLQGFLRCPSLDQPGSVLFIDPRLRVHPTPETHIDEYDSLIAAAAYMPNALVLTPDPSAPRPTLVVSPVAYSIAPSPDRALAAAKAETAAAVVAAHRQGHPRYVHYVAFITLPVDELSLLIEVLNKAQGDLLVDWMNTLNGLPLIHHLSTKKTYSNSYELQVRLDFLADPSAASRYSVSGKYQIYEASALNDLNDDDIHSSEWDDDDFGESDEDELYENSDAIFERKNSSGVISNLNSDQLTLTYTPQDN